MALFARTIFYTIGFSAQTHEWTVQSILLGFGVCFLSIIFVFLLKGKQARVMLKSDCLVTFHSVRPHKIGRLSGLGSLIKENANNKALLKDGMDEVVASQKECGHLSLS